MNTNNKTITIALVAILAIGVGTFAVTSDSDVTSGLYKTETDSAHFTNTEYNPNAIHAQWITVDPVEIAQFSDYVVKGEIVDITYDSIIVAEADPNFVIDGVPFVPTLDATVYTVKIHDNVKGQKSNTIEVTSFVPSKIGYNIGDKVLVMASSIEDRNEMIGGPFSMYKLEKGEAIGHEFTFDEIQFEDTIKKSEDKSKELNLQVKSTQK